MRRWFLLGRMRGMRAQLYAHVTVLAAVAVLALAAIQSPVYAVLTLASLLTLIFVHELGHAFVAHRLGYSVRAIHVGLIHGLCVIEAPENRWDGALIAWGGVAAQFLLAIPFWIVDVLWSDPLGYLGPPVLVLAYWSSVIAFINLLPLRGFDGETAWSLFPLLRNRTAARRDAKAALAKARRRR